MAENAVLFASEFEIGLLNKDLRVFRDDGCVLAIVFEVPLAIKVERIDVEPEFGEEFCIEVAEFAIFVQGVLWIFSEVS